MVNRTTANNESDCATHLKKVVEQCLAVLQEDKESATEAESGRSRCSVLPLHIDAVNLQKRALSEAAKALVKLWGISEPRALRPQSLRVSRSTS